MEPRLFHHTNGKLIELDRSQEWPVTECFSTIGGEITLLYDSGMKDYEVDDLIRQCFEIVRTTPQEAS